MPKIAELVLISVEKSTSAPRSLKGKKCNDFKHGENEVTSLVYVSRGCIGCATARQRLLTHYAASPRREMLHLPYKINLAEHFAIIAALVEMVRENPYTPFAALYIVKHHRWKRLLLAS